MTCYQQNEVHLT